MQITLEATPTPALRQELFTRIDAYNDACTGLTEPVQPLALVLRDPERRPEGGLLGVSYYGWLIVTQLFVPAPLRGHRMGSLLLRLAESEALARGCHGIWLESFSFQAPGFYRRHGFEEFGALADYPPGHIRHFFAKTGLAHTPAAPGVAAAKRIEPEDQEFIDAQLRAFNDAAIGPGPGTASHFALTVRDDAGTLQGGLYARLGRGWMFVETVVLAEPLRRQGLGRRLLAMAEAEALRRGATAAWLDSFSFQAPGFYRRQGWREFGVLPAYPAGHARHFLTKRLDAPTTAAE